MNADLAEKLYPSAATVAAAPAAAVPAPPTIAERVYPPPAAPMGGSAPAPVSVATAAAPETDPEIAALRSSYEYKLYGPGSAAAVPEERFTQAIGAAVGGVVITEDHARAALADVRRAASDFGLSESEAKALVDARVPEDRQSAKAAAWQRLVREHGDDAPRALQAAQRVIHANPGFARMLDATGVGDSPEVVAMLARRGLGLAASGRLTVRNPK